MASSFKSVLKSLALSLFWLSASVPASLMPALQVCAAESPATTEKADHDGSNFDRDRLVAWCIVPFDAKNRGPKERAEMVRRLGLSRVAYDWRDQHVPTFEEEILQYKEHGIEYFAFWSWHDAMEPLIRKHNIHPQIWMMFGEPAGTQEEKVAAAAASLLPMVEKTKSLGLKLGLYNHGGWSGEPANMVAVCQYLKDHHQAENVGIVYNLHHGHDHIADFKQQLVLMQPWLICLNINGMNDGAQPKILPVGQGQHEQDLIRIIHEAKYSGPIGIIDHREQLDAEESLQQNLNGLPKILDSIGNSRSARTYSK